MVDKNLFLYDLAVVAIFKDEGRYLKEWLDYHLLAGVEHFYLYNNDSTDDYKEVLAPYVEKNLVTLTDWPGKIMQMPAYEDAIENYRFECRYMAFIDLDEFIYPKLTGGGRITEVVDEILSRDENAAGLAINWQCFGSNGHEKADYSRGVLERFTRRAPSDWEGGRGHIKITFNGNLFKKSIDNPRFIRYRINPHFAFYFNEKFSLNSNGENISEWMYQKPVLADKIVVNHYYTKSAEEYAKTKMRRGWACQNINPYDDENFYWNDQNDVFDDGILKYRTARAENFSFESDEHRANRVINTLVKTLTQPLPVDDDRKFFVDKLETFLTCRAVAEKFQIKIGDHFAEEIALAWIYRTLVEPMTYAEIQQLLKALPEILSRPFQICKRINDFTRTKILPLFCEALKNSNVVMEYKDWILRSDLLYIQQLLRLIK